MAEYEFHPLADLFPLIDGEEFDALASDIKEERLTRADYAVPGKDSRRT